MGKPQQPRSYVDLESLFPDGVAPKSVELHLEVTDPEVVAELWQRPEGMERERFALAALRLGVLSLRMASGSLDQGVIREAGQKLLSDMRELLVGRAHDMTRDLAESLAKYLDPQSGLFPQRLQALMQKDGEVERLFQSHLAPNDSMLARTLAAHLGEGSPFFQMLSPNDARGLRSQVSQVLEVALKDQRTHILREFSLDHKESALCKLVGEITTNQDLFQKALKGQFDTIHQEFSLDQPNSALSRLVGRVEAARQKIAEEFSSDNDHSALNKLSRLLQNTSNQIAMNLTLDDEQSALARLKRELQGTLDELSKRNVDFHAEVRETLAYLKGTREEASRSTRHGLAFEDQLGEVLAKLAQQQGDIHQPTGNLTGAIKNCKTGDHVIELGPDSPAPGVFIAWEAKEDKRWDLNRALEESEESRKNRQAQIGVFVFSSKAVPASLQPFARYGNHLVIIWDADDPATDLYIKAAYSVAKALAVRIREAGKHEEKALEQLDLATRQVEKQIGYLEQIKKWAETIQSNGKQIAERVEKMKCDLEKEVGQLDEQIHALRASEEEAAV
jgi:hypothetical protein